MITGRGFTLKLAEQKDFKAILEIAAGNADQLFWDRGEISLDDVFGTLLATDPGTSSRLWGIWQDQQIIGFITLNHISAIHQSAEVGYLGIRADKATPWLAGEISDTILEFSFETLGLNRIQWRVFESNKGFLAVAKRKGFTLEGTQKEVIHRKGGFDNLRLFAMLASEWKAKKKCQ